MHKILLHFSEFFSWVSSGYIDINLNRVNNFSFGETSFELLLDSYDNLKISEPESYVIATLIPDWSKYIKVTSSSRASKMSLKIESVFNFQTLTKDAQLRVSPQTERLMVKFSEPEFESLWISYKNKVELNQIRENGVNFLGLFKFPDNTHKPTINIDDSALGKLLSRLIDYDIDKQLEVEKGKSSYGLLEFCIRLSMNFPPEWRKTDERYLRLKELRDSQLSNESWSTCSFLDFPEICTALKSFNEDSYQFFGADSISLACFFQHRVEFLDSQEKLNLEAVIRDASRMFINKYDYANFNFLYLIGCLIGPEKVVELKYFHTDANYPFFKADKTKGNSPIDFMIPRLVAEPPQNKLISAEEAVPVNVSNDQSIHLGDSLTLEVIVEKRPDELSTVFETEQVKSASEIKNEIVDKIEKETSSISESCEQNTSLNLLENKGANKSKEKKQRVNKTDGGKKSTKTPHKVSDSSILDTEQKSLDQLPSMENIEKSPQEAMDLSAKKT